MLQFVNLMYGPWKIDPSDKKKSAMKMVCLGEEQKVQALVGEDRSKLAAQLRPSHVEFYPANYVHE